ncbi:hypothetical protein BH708_03895 [Brachybacterium sp. P6-10-X1]|uniref:hypothetical protein n=1 Tax=Brachybacterium sp. P6-10-X1 TaxID=1903186 RepID=UPI000971A0CF|nr:hypothetical protein [Brachybacterium sp. P6-10-X1]APX32011.1 hypothetical protein BH708_03895 [Brachybacterium sp. P6-10-X1]
MSDIEITEPEGGEALQIWLDGRTRFAKLFAHQARKFAATEGMPREVAIWFAATDRADSVGHAIFEPGELESIVGGGDRGVQRAIVKGRSLGLLDDPTNSRHVWINGAEDGSQYGQNLAAKRWVHGIGYPGPGRNHGTP